MKISICGCGFVGNAIHHFLSKKVIYVTKTYDLYKNIGSFEDIIDSDILFICLPTSYNEELQSYDMT